MSMAFPQPVTVVRKAAGAVTGTAVLHLHPRNTGAHAIDVPPSIDGKTSLGVPVARVEDELTALGVAPGTGGARVDRCRGL